MNMRVAVLASGNGTNLQVLLDAAAAGRLPAEIVLVAGDRADARALDRAREAGVPTAVFGGGKAGVDERDAALLDLLEKHDPHLIVLAGYMRRIGPAAVAAYRHRIINVHPSLLPAFPGLDAPAQAVAHGVKVSGCTVHFVDEGLDTGPVIAQAAVPVLPGDDAGALHRRIQEAEHRLLPRVVDQFARGLISVEGRRVTVAGRARRRALLSVSDKEGIVDFARRLVDAGWEIVSTGGTRSALEGAGIPVTAVDDVTGFPEILGGRVKSLHPLIHGALLARRDDAGHMDELDRHGIAPIDLVAVNLYPFEEARDGGAAGMDLLEQIDIGGPALIRAAAKNWPAVTVVTDPRDYPAVAEVIAAGNYEGDAARALRRSLAAGAFAHTAFYDSVVAGTLEAGAIPAEGGSKGGRDGAAHGDGAADAGSGDGAAAAGVGSPVGEGSAGGGSEGEGPGRRAGGAESAGALPERIVVALRREQVLRYGENPHQKAALYREASHPRGAGARFGAGGGAPGGIMDAVQLQGKELSYNNYQDALAAWNMASDFRRPFAAIIKHTNPCGAAVADDIGSAYAAARQADPVSAFGGIVALNRAVDEAAAELLAETFLEVVIAPSFTAEARERLASRKNLRLLEAELPGMGTEPGTAPGGGPGRIRGGAASGPARGTAVGFGGLHGVPMAGGMLVQDQDRRPPSPEEWKTVTKAVPTPEMMADLELAWGLVKWVKSNAIVLAAGGRTVGISGGQTSRVAAVEQALERAGEKARGAVMASDAFFPFPDGVVPAGRRGVAAVVQPGGSIRDKEVIAACDDLGMVMMFTGVRHFLH